MQYVRTLPLHKDSLWREKRPLIGHIDIELTERCNNVCIHCLINQPEYDTTVRSGEMNTPFVKNILRQASELGCLTVRFTGGEPLLREDFSELYLFARRLGIRVILFTNARLVTAEIIQLLARTPPGRPIEVTVYGMHAESYDGSAGVPGAYDEFRRGVELLQTYNIPTIVKSCILPSNRNEIAEFETFARSLPAMGGRPAYTMNYDLRARRDNPAKNRAIESLRLTPDETLTILANDPDYRNNMKVFCGKFMGSPGDRLFTCGAGHGACIDAYGKIQMCMLLRHPAMVYDLYGEDMGMKDSSRLRYALTEFFPRLRGMRAGNPEYLRRCARCFLKGLCEQCPAKSWIEHGSLDTPLEYLCRVTHSQARYLGLVFENENAWELQTEVWQDRIKRFTADT